MEARRGSYGGTVPMHEIVGYHNEDVHKKLNKIKDLTALWYTCLIDHHKDKDCHFVIETRFSYDGQLKYSIWHYGYVSGEWMHDFTSYDEALDYLIVSIIEQVGGHATKNIEDAETSPNGVWLHFETIADEVSFWKSKLDKLEEIKCQ